jgi:hypothetical protein
VLEIVASCAYCRSGCSSGSDQVGGRIWRLLVAVRGWMGEVMVSAS